MMEMRRITFDENWGGPPPYLSIDTWPANEKMNAIYAAVAAAVLQPHMLAIQMGRVSDETIARIFAHLYSEAVIIGSPDPIYDGFTKERWRDWLIEHEAHREAMRRFCSVRRNYESADEREEREAARRRQSEAAGETLVVGELIEDEEDVEIVDEAAVSDGGV